jgi:hypothetical protein
MMTRGAVTTIFVILLIGLIFLAINIKKAYKVLPVATFNKLEVPSFADWREFSAQSGKFKVFLPAAPQYVKESVNIPNTDKKRKYEMYVAQKVNGTIFMINLITYPTEVDTSNKNQILRDIINEMVEANTGNQLTELQDTIYQQHPALDFHIVNQELNIQGKAFMIEKTLYLLAYIAKEMDFTRAEYDHFIDSFQIFFPNQ